MEAPAVTLLLGDCLDRMRELPDGSVDAIHAARAEAGQLRLEIA